MIAIADPIHELQGSMVERRFSRVIFDDDESARDARRIADHPKRIARMVQDIDKQAAIEGLVIKWQTDSVKAEARDGALRTREEFSACDAEPRDRLRDEPRNGSIAASDVEQSGNWRKRRR
jgi:hypothetical protein